LPKKSGIRREIKHPWSRPVARSTHKKNASEIPVKRNKKGIKTTKISRNSKGIFHHFI
jgi:hypothetical protein